MRVYSKACRLLVEVAAVATVVSLFADVAFAPLPDTHLPRRLALWVPWAAGTLPAWATSEERGAGLITLEALEGKVRRLVAQSPVFAITDPSGAPVLVPQEISGEKLGRFYFDQDEASIELRKIISGGGVGGSNKLEVREIPLVDVFMPLVVEGKPTEVGGRFQLEPSLKELRAAQRRLGVESLGASGQVPLFVCPSLELERSGDVSPRIPAFLHEADLQDAVDKARLKGEDAEVVVTTLQRVVEDFGKSAQANDASSKLLVVGDLQEIGLGTWR